MKQDTPHKQHHQLYHHHVAEPAIAKHELTAEVGREEMISVAAYYRSLHHGFDKSDPFLDWLAAEQAIDAMLMQSNVIKIH